jgi:hypothetical protein
MFEHIANTNLKETKSNGVTASIIKTLELQCGNFDQTNPKLKL